MPSSLRGTLARVAMICPRTGTIPERPERNGKRCEAYPFVACRTLLHNIDPLGVCSSHRLSPVAVDGVIEVTGVFVCKPKDPSLDFAK